MCSTAVKQAGARANSELKRKVAQPPALCGSIQCQFKRFMHNSTTLQYSNGKTAHCKTQTAQAAGASSSSEGATAVAALSVTAAFGLVPTGFQPVSRASLMDMYIVILIASLERGRVSN